MKKHLKALLPMALIQWYRDFRRQFSAFKHLPPKEVFTHIYNTNRWGSAESVSGLGSELKNTEGLVESLSSLFRELGIRSVLDLPCGDFNWMNQMDLNKVDYLGADIVEALVQHNQEIYGQLPTVRFEVLDMLTDDLPCMDIMLVRDCLVHFSNRDIQTALQNIRRSGCTYLLTTTFNQLPKNKDIITGEWRPVNLQGEPFSLPAPLLLLAEQSDGPGGMPGRKSLGLWRIQDI